MADDVIHERPEGRLAQGTITAEVWTVAAIAVIPALVFVGLVAWKIRRTLRERRGPVSSRRGGSLRPPPPGSRV